MEDKAVAPGEVRAKLGHGIRQSAGMADNRQSPVTHGDHLSQAAGFEARRHQEHIAAAVDQVRQGFLEGDKDGHLLRESGRRYLPEHVLIVRPTPPQDYQLGPGLLENACLSPAHRYRCPFVHPVAVPYLSRE